MKTFKEGDRVTHHRHGAGTVVHAYEGTGSTTVQFDSHGKVMTETAMLKPLPTKPKFKIGDRVSHPIHRDGTVENYSEHSGLYTVDVGGGRAYYALAHEIEHAVPPATYRICIGEITGAAHVPGSLTAKEVANYINDSVDWRVVQEIRITKEGN